MIIFIAVFILLVGGFLFIILKIVNKTKNSYWKGKVIEKLYHAIRENPEIKTTTDYFTLVVKTDEGLIRKVAVRKDMYESTEVGDTLEKPKGKLNPVKIS